MFLNLAPKSETYHPKYAG